MTLPTEKRVVVLARHNPVEAMRVAAGLTIFDHQVTVVFTHGLLELTDAVVEQAELLSLSEVEVHSLYEDPEVPQIMESDFRQLIAETDFVATI